MIRMGVTLLVVLGALGAAVWLGLHELWLAADPPREVTRMLELPAEEPAAVKPAEEPLAEPEPTPRPEPAPVVKTATPAAPPSAEEPEALPVVVHHFEEAPLLEDEPSFAEPEEATPPLDASADLVRRMLAIYPRTRSRR